MIRKKRKIKNFVLKTVTLLSMSLGVFSGLMIDTGEFQYKIMLMGSMIWLALFALANGGLELLREDKSVMS